MAGLYTGATGLWGGFSGLLYGSTSLSTPPGLLADAASWTPAVLFSSGEQGAWYDPSDLDRYMSPVGSELSNQDFTTYNNYGPTPFDTFTATTNSLRLANATNKTTIASSPDAISVVSGRYYSVVYTVTVVSGGFDVSIRNNVGATSYVASATLTTSGTYSLVLAATVTENVVFQITARSGIADYTFTNISVKELTAINTATMFTDAAGTTPVTAVEQPVGLLLDKSKGLALGAELVTNGDFSDGLTGWTYNASVWSSSGGIANKVSFAASADLVQGTSVVGRTYKITYTVTSFTGGSHYPRAGGVAGPVNTGTGTFTAYVVAGATSGYGVGASQSAVLSIDNISVRELPGNHASQSTAASRPVLSARVNQLTYSEQFDNAAWTKSNVVISANAITAPDGALTGDKLYPLTTGSNRFVYQPLTLASGLYRFSVRAKAGEKSILYIDLTGAGTTQAFFDLSTGTVGSVSAGYSATITSLGNGWFECSATNNSPSSYSFGGVYGVADANGSTSVTASGTSGIYIWGADLRVTNVGVNLPAYQRVGAAVTATTNPAVTGVPDYDTNGFPLYLKFDGVDDSLATGTIDFSATDKMSVFAGARKLSDAAGGEIVNLGNVTSVNGSFELRGPRAAAPNYMFGSRGTSFADANIASGYSAPITNVVTGIADIAVDLCALRINGTVVASPTTDQGTGNYSSGVVFVGRLGGTALSYNGHLYSLIVRGALSTDAQIASTETWVNGKTKAY